MDDAGFSGPGHLYLSPNVLRLFDNQTVAVSAHTGWAT